MGSRRNSGSKVDTRNKIIEADRAAELARDPGTTVVIGAFDPLLAAHVRELQRVRNRTAGGPLLIVLAQPVEALLPLRARAEMVAALRMVDFVFPAGGDTEAERFLSPQAVDFRPDDRERALHLTEHVQRRHTP